jgi:hypothetical protein
VKSKAKWNKHWKGHFNYTHWNCIYYTLWKQITAAMLDEKQMKMKIWRYTFGNKLITAATVTSVNTNETHIISILRITLHGFPFSTHI